MTIDTEDPNFQSDFQNLSTQVRSFVQALKRWDSDEPEFVKHAQQVEVALTRVEGWVNEDQTYSIDDLYDPAMGKERPPKIFGL